MGLLRFLVPECEPLTQSALDRAYFTGMDEVPWVSQIIRTDDGFTMDRPVRDSGCLHIPWSVDGHGEILLSTGSLMERDAPYLLEMELARGTLNRIRNQIAAWEMAGMTLPDSVGQQMTEATSLFASAVTTAEAATTVGPLVRRSLRVSLDLAEAIGASYAEQTLDRRHATAPNLPTMLGASLGDTPLGDSEARGFLEAFNTALLPMSWRRIEAGEGETNWTLTDRQVQWCLAHRVRICSGPLVCLDGTDVPDWLYLWEEDIENVMSFVTQFVREAVLRYRGRVHVWQCASRINVSHFLGLSQQMKIRLLARVLEIVRELDPKTPTVVTFDQPWGERLAQREQDLPLHFADTILRSDLGVSGIGIEMNLGYEPDGTCRRDVIEMSRQLDRWSTLGLPMIVNVVVPGGYGDDPLARSKRHVGVEGWTAERQDEWVRQMVPIFLSKNAVQGIFWNQFRDNASHELPHGGLIDPQANPKPALASLAALRQAHLS